MYALNLDVEFMADANINDFPTVQKSENRQEENDLQIAQLLKEEIKELKRIIQEQQQEIIELNQQIAKIQVEREKQELSLNTKENEFVQIQTELMSMKQAFDQTCYNLKSKQEQAIRLGSENDKLQNLINQQIQSIQNLEKLLEEEQQSKDLTRLALDKDLLRADQKIKDLQKLLNEYEEIRNQHSQAIQSNLEQEKEIQLLKSRLEKATREKLEISEEAKELIKRVKKENSEIEYLVDRRVINKFLINYLHPDLSQKAKFQMLESLAGILQFTMQERIQLGLEGAVKSTIVQGESPTNAKDLLKNLAKYMENLEND